MIFMDTSAFLALVNRRDIHHSKDLDFKASNKGQAPG